MNRVMDAIIEDDPVLKSFRTAVRAAYGDRLQRALLYGSRARGDARPDSDYDIAVFLHGIESRWEEMKHLADISTDILDATGEVIHATPFGPGALEERTLLVHEIRKDGRDLL